MKRVLILLAILALFAAPTYAQSFTNAPAPAFLGATMDAQGNIVNPSGVEFTPSPDHDATDLGGPKLTKYTLDFKKVGQTAVALNLDIAKPNVVGGKITYVFPASYRNSLGAGDFTVTVNAIGPGGVGVSSPSDPFSVAAAAPAAAGKPVIKQ